ncbi:MAG: hypothetical protein MUF77_10230 [Leptospira sp.]|jgi:hypothetical protein|nr:hypothetical protein [Leptospira sp.]
MENLHLRVCITCGYRKYLTPSHLFKVNSLYKLADPTDLNLIVCQCIFCHRKYELLPPIRRVLYWKEQGFLSLANTMQEVIDGTYIRPE